MIRTRRDHELEDFLAPFDWILDHQTVVAVVSPTLAQARRELGCIPRRAWRRVETVEQARDLDRGQSAYLLLNGPWPTRTRAARDAILHELQARGVPQVEADELIALHERVREQS